MWIVALAACTYPTEQLLDTVSPAEGRPTAGPHDYPPIDLTKPDDDPGDTDTDTGPDPLDGDVSRGRCLYLSGNPAHVTGGDWNLPTFGSDRTIELAFKSPKTTPPNSQAWAVSYGNLSASQAFYAGIQTDHPAATQIGDAVNAPDIDATDDAWHHLAVVVQNGTTTLYWDGVEVASKAMLLDTRLGGGLVLGNALPNDGDKYFEGHIDEVRIWNIARTPGEIRRFATRRADPSHPDLRLYFDFDGPAVIGDSAQIADQTGNHNIVFHGDTNSPRTEDCP